MRHRRAELTRRELLRAGLGASAAALAAGTLPGTVRAALAAPRGEGCSSLDDIEHVVILIQENRSFDHYFGTHPGVLGFSDPHALRLADGQLVFEQPNPQNTTDPPIGRLLPFRLDTSRLPTQGANGSCTEDITHSWGAQHDCWNGGRLDRFAVVHLREDDPYGAAVMGYYTRDDLPFYRAVADAFTLCDRYHCSVLGPTDPNRLYAMTATIDPDGRGGGPILSNPDFTHFGQYDWTTYPERLEAAGVTWKQYSDPELMLSSSNVLQLFKAYSDPTTDLYARGVLPTFPEDFSKDVLSGALPQVSWLQLDDATSDHPPDPPHLGEDALGQVLTLLTANPSVWSRTLLIVTWDENGGFFDHVPPPTSAPGTAGEWLTAGTAQPRGPIGLGFRVPTLVISPFTRGGWVCSDILDHTSTLLFLERRFGVEVPNLSSWRRATVGDLTGALDVARPPDASVPSLPVTAARAPVVVAGCATGGALLNSVGPTPPAYPVPSPQRMPTQEPGRALRPSGMCAPRAPERPTVRDAGGAQAARRDATLSSLPDTASVGSPAAGLLAAGFAGLVALRSLRARRSDGDLDVTPGRAGEAWKGRDSTP